MPEQRAWRVFRPRLLLVLSLAVGAAAGLGGSWEAPSATRRLLTPGRSSLGEGGRQLLARAAALDAQKRASIEADVRVASQAGKHGGGGASRVGGSQGSQASGGNAQRSAFWTAVWRSYLVILFLEIGDRTFFIAALMSAKHPAMTVFVGAFGALLLMTVLSTALGVAAPLLLPHSVTHWAGAAIFLFYGVTMLRKARVTPAAQEGEAPEELGEVEEELKEQEDHPKGKYAAAGGLWAKHVPPVLAQTFVMTFLAEWGDRSQIATITMGADYDALGICVGGSAGHATATALAVVGGRLLAARISERTMGFAGGATFLLFGILACFEDPNSDITSHAVPLWAKSLG